MIKTVYIAGKMRGMPEFNFPAFDAARDAWEAKGWDVISPADMDRRIDGAQPTVETVKSFATYMRRDIAALLSVDAIAFLPNWEESQGARIEYTVGKALDLELYDAITFGPLIDPEMSFTFVTPASNSWGSEVKLYPVVGKADLKQRKVNA